MRLTYAVAKENVGKYIDCYRRIFGNYPMKIIETNRGIMVRDRLGVCMPIPETECDFNVHNYDYIFSMDGDE